MESRIRDREAARRDGCGLFGRQGMLREIAEMQTMPMPMPYRPRNAADGPLNSDVRAMERQMRKEARVQALLEERAEQEKVTSEARDFRRSLATASSAPQLPTAGLALGLGLTPLVVPEEMERQKLRLACKIETLSFLNGYHNAVGKMT